MMNAIKEWLFLRRLLKKKKNDLAEIKMDLYYLKECKNVLFLRPEIDKLRTSLKEEQQKKENDRDSKKINDIAYKIAEKEQLLKNYGKWQDAAGDISDYIELIELCLTNPEKRKLI